MTSRYEAADLGSVAPIPFSARENKVSVGQFGEVLDPAPAIAPLIAALPDVLAAADLRRVVERWSASLDASRAVVLLVGGHVVKTGCSPFLIDLIERGWVTHLAFNGATAIHDFEIACFGETSEDVAGNLADGTFGLADETGRWMAEAAALAVREGLGLGEALGRWLVERDPAVAHRESSILALGAASHRDFRVLAAGLRDLDAGGLVANLGSAVVLPEVFVKALNVARRLWAPIRSFTAVDLDMIRHYRPTVNVIGRPVLEGGEGIHLTGHHEITIPLLYYALRARRDR
jgi:hypothetical protein